MTVATKKLKKKGSGRTKEKETTRSDGRSRQGAQSRQTRATRVSGLAQLLRDRVGLSPSSNKTRSTDPRSNRNRGPTWFATAA